MADDGVSFKLDGNSYSLDDFELGELEWLEEEVGFSFAQLESGNKDAMDKLMSMKSVTRIVWLIKKRDDPDFTLDQARKIKLSAVIDEPESNGKAAAKRRPTRAVADGS